MKARFYTSFSLGLALSALPFVGGCTEPGADLASSLIPSAIAEPTVAAISTNAPAENPPPLVAETELVPAEDVAANVVVPAPAPDSGKKLPASSKPTPPAAEVIKLAQAGVDETVMLNYITNASSMFVLSSDDIIYFNDLGVAGSVITAMMQHDQELKGAWPNQAGQPPQVAAQAAAPTYVNAPQPEPQPQPQPAPVEAPPPSGANVTYNYFNDSLSPYGTWVDVEGYGRCWQPTVVVVNPGWRPYCDRGRWIYSDCGWYWLSDYSWGATTFHYGRWLSHPRYGWCWWPDRVWAPSWVSWRYSGDYCGWAPLPPAAYYRSGFGFSYYGNSVGVNFQFGLGASCFTFVSWGHFRDPHPYHYRIPSHQVTQFYNHTTVVNNYGAGRSGAVINHGIPADRVREHTRTELRPVSLRDHIDSGGLRGERLEGNGRSLVVNRPRIPESAAAKPLTTPPLHADPAPQRGRQPAAPTATSAPNFTRTPAAPGGTARVPGRDGQTEAGRDRNNRFGSAAPPQDSVTGSVRTPPASPPAGIASPANQPPRDNRGTTRPREDRPQNPNRNLPSPSPAPAAAPNNRPTPGAPAAQSASPKSTVVIGRRDPNPGRDHNADSERLASITRAGSSANVPRTTQNWSAPTSPAPVQSSAAAQRVQSAAPAYTPQVSQPPRVVHQENRYTPPQPSYTQPRQAAPAPVYTAPAPAQRIYPSAPVYSAPRPAPTPAYTPPPSRSQNNESRSAPERSSSGHNKRDN